MSRLVRNRTVSALPLWDAAILLRPSGVNPNSDARCIMSSVRRLAMATEADRIGSPDGDFALVPNFRMFPVASAPGA